MYSIQCTNYKLHWLHPIINNSTDLELSILMSCVDKNVRQIILIYYFSNLISCGISSLKVP